MQQQSCLWTRTSYSDILQARHSCTVLISNIRVSVKIAGEGVYWNLPEKSGEVISRSHESLRTNLMGGARDSQPSGIFHVTRMEGSVYISVLVLAYFTH